MKLFDSPQKNRRLTPKELQEEKIDSAIWKREMKHFLLDVPYYGIPEPVVNFNLGYK